MRLIHLIIVQIVLYKVKYSNMLLQIIIPDIKTECHLCRFVHLGTGVQDIKYYIGNYFLVESFDK